MLPCKTCQSGPHNLETGKPITYTSQGKELPTIDPNWKPPCVSGAEKCPKGDPENAKRIELSDKNYRAFWHWQRMRAVGATEREKADPIVRRNAALIEGMYQPWERKQQAMETLELLLMVKR
jgi:hypothetical protein